MYEVEALSAPDTDDRNPFPVTVWVTFDLGEAVKEAESRYIEGSYDLFRVWEVDQEGTKIKVVYSTSELIEGDEVKP